MVQECLVEILHIWWQSQKRARCVSYLRQRISLLAEFDFPLQMQIVLHLRGTSQRTSKASERTWSALLAFWRSDGGCWTMDFIITTLTLVRDFCDMLLPEQLPGWPDGEDQRWGWSGSSDWRWWHLVRWAHYKLFHRHIDLALSKQFAKRRSLLAKHLHVFRQKGAM